MAIVLFQWVSFAAMLSRTLNPLSVGCRQHIGWVLPFRSWSVIGLLSFLLPVFVLYVVYVLRCIIYMYKSLLSFVFNYDLVWFFIAKAFLFSSVIFKSYSPLSNSRQNQIVVTKRGCSTVGYAGYRACSGRPLLWVRRGVEYKFMLFLCGVLFLC